MPSFRIPDDLVDLLRQRRVIPFIGAGFSAVHDVPTWESLLGDLAHEIQESADVDPVLDFKEISEACGKDNLQIAEYLYLIAGESIGPIRHGLSNALRSATPLLQSTPHVELVNLGAPHVYTTNFDDLIERTYRELGLTVDVIAVPRDMALSHADRTEIVKYHGDMRHEHTLVLTESQYYERLEFESPVDLKFRSDLLGRSVLFMGYSFRDINIRVIWFRLMQMMQDIPRKDRPPSYIVRLSSNPVLDALYEAVGLRTLIIDPEGAATSPEARNALLSDFMMELSLRSAPDGRIPGSDDQAYVSIGLVERAREQLDSLAVPPTRTRIARTPTGGFVRRRVPAPGDIVAPTPLLAAIDRLLARRITDFTARPIADFLQALARTVDTVASRADLAAQLASWFTSQRGAAPGLTLIVSRSLLRTLAREPLLASLQINWGEIWNPSLTENDAKKLLSIFEEEVAGHEDGSIEDDDLAFAVDIGKRLADGSLLLDGEETDDLKAEARSLIERAAEMYPSAADYEPPADSPPIPVALQEEIEARLLEQEEEYEEEEHEP
jgi:hypothetical protein